MYENQRLPHFRPPTSIQGCPGAGLNRHGCLPGWQAVAVQLLWTLSKLACLKAGKRETINQAIPSICRPIGYAEAQDAQPVPGRTVAPISRSPVVLLGVTLDRNYGPCSCSCWSRREHNVSKQRDVRPPSKRPRYASVPECLADVVRVKLSQQLNPERPDRLAVLHASSVRKMSLRAAVLICLQVTALRVLPDHSEQCRLAELSRSSHIICDHFTTCMLA